MTNLTKFSLFSLYTYAEKKLKIFHTVYMHLTTISKAIRWQYDLKFSWCMISICQGIISNCFNKRFFWQIYSKETILACTTMIDDQKYCSRIWNIGWFIDLEPGVRTQKIRITHFVLFHTHHMMIRMHQ